MLDHSTIATKGRYCLPGGEDVSCLVDLSAPDIFELHRLSDGPTPAVGRRITCYLDNIGSVEGVVLHGGPSSFVFQIVANPERRARIDARLAWLRTAEGRNDQRTSARIVPVHREVQIQLLGVGVAEAVVADLSMTGAALLLNERPRVGATVTVGKRYATVVRHTLEGIGVAFRLPFGPLTFNERVIL